MNLEQMLEEWDKDPNDLDFAESLIQLLRIELAGKESVIKELHGDIEWYRKDWKDQMIQDQGIDDEKS